MNAATRADAPAKVNLYLHVLGRRPDGYHRLDSLIVFAALCDTVMVEAAPAGSFTIDAAGPFAAGLPADGEANLVLRAARALDAAAGGGHGCRVRLVKNIPLAAGLGGGSADAAAALNALAQQWDACAVDLAPIALSLGADVPVCLGAAPAFVSGIGEEVAPAPALPPLGLVLANPGTAVDTGAVFAALQAGSGRREIPRPARFAGFAELIAFLGATANDLTDAAVAMVPEIAAVLDALGRAPGAALARMSGSGATCFALFADADAAARAAAAIARRHPGWWLWAGGLRAGR